METENRESICKKLEVVIDKTEYFLKALPIISIVGSLLLGFEKINNEILSALKSMLCGIPKYYFTNSNILLYICLFCFCIVVISCIWPIVLLLQGKKIRIIDVAIPIIVIGAFITFCVICSLFLKENGNTQITELSEALQGYYCPIIVALILPIIVFILFLFLAEKLKSASVFEKKIIDTVSVIVIFICCIIFFGALIFAISFGELNKAIQDIQNDENYEIIIRDNKHKIYDVIMSEYDGRLVVLNGCESNGSLHIHTNFGYRLINRSDDQTVYFRNFNKVEFD